VKAPGIWVGYFRLKGMTSKKEVKKNKYKNKQQLVDGLLLKMYKTPPTEEKTLENDDDD